MEEILKKYNLETKTQFKNNTYIVTKWNWEFSECEKFQLEANKFVRLNLDKKVFIFTSHPHVFTLGHGNERGDDSLLAHDSKMKLPFPLYKIKRGGGITFHYPGQWIHYRIQSINPTYTLHHHMCSLLTSVRDELQNTFNLDHVIATSKLMGVWRNKRKLASIGVGVERFVTLHGLALNLLDDELMFKNLSLIHPCGMSATTYQTVESLFSLKSAALFEQFHENYLRDFV